MELRFTAIVIRKKEVGETDRLYTFYTREKGKVQSKGVGVRKPQAKLASSLETLMLSDIAIVRTRGIGRITGAITEETFPNLRSDLDTLLLATESLRMFDRLIGLEEPDALVFDLLREYLFLLDGLVESGEQERAPLLAEGFFFQLASKLGYHLETGICATSGEKLGSGKQYAISPEAGGIILAHNADQYALAVSENVVKVLRLFFTNRLATFRKIRLSASDMNQLSQARSVFFRYITR